LQPYAAQVEPIPTQRCEDERDRDKDPAKDKDRDRDALSRGSIDTKVVRSGEVRHVRSVPGKGQLGLLTLAYIVIASVTYRNIGLFEEQFLTEVHHPLRRAINPRSLVWRKHPGYRFGCF
jgi:hypothetical protein